MCINGHLDTDYSYGVSARDVLPRCRQLFWPAVPPDCRAGFDFTLLFEQTVLSILPCGLFLLVSWSQLARTWKSAPVVPARGTLYLAKLAAAAVYAALRLAALVLWSLLPEARRTTAAIPDAVVNLVSAVTAGLVSNLSHSRSVRPSTTLAVFLALTLLFDVAIARTLWLTSDGPPRLAAVFTAAVAAKFVLLVLEAGEKISLPSAESRSSIYSRSFFWWLGPLLLKGYRSTLGLQDLDQLENPLASERMCEDMTAAWEKGKSSGASVFFYLFMNR